METGSGSTRSVWMTGTRLPEFPRLEKDVVADVCVIGAGIAGLSVAYHLARAGRDVVVLEDGSTIGAGETSRTTSHVSNALDDRYYVLAHLHGEEGARIAAESHAAAIDSIERIAREEDIGCQFERLDGFLFTPPGDPQTELERELEACHAAGLTGVEWVDRAPLQGFETGRCLRFPRQGQMHPMRYLSGLARATVRHGGSVYTSTHAATIEGGDGEGRVETEDGHTVRAKHLVVATNTPVQDMLKIHTKQYPYRTYVLTARVPAGSATRALYWDTPSPYHYVRLTGEGDHELLVVGGEDHKTGQEREDHHPYRELHAWAKARFPMMGEVVHRWSGQVMEPVDSVAFIGRNPGDDNVWIVTGDSGNGITHGAIAGMLIPELIAGREHPWAKLYDPARKSLRSAMEFVRENVNMAAQYGSWLTGGEVHDEDEIPRGSGAVMREGLHKVAVYRDEHGALHRFNATCPHLGALVGWNAEECTWDCPAHGSRFDALGNVVNGPANGNLSPAKRAPDKRKSA